jgi:hypothetical protein
MGAASSSQDIATAMQKKVRSQPKDCQLLHVHLITDVHAKARGVGW